MATRQHRLEFGVLKVNLREILAWEKIFAKIKKTDIDGGGPKSFKSYSTWWRQQNNKFLWEC